MTATPPRKKNRIVLWLAIIFIVSAIVATALLANDKRNLRILAAYYKLPWFDVEKTARQKAAPPPPTRSARVRPAPRLLLPPHLLDPVQPAVASAFIREWRVPGETLCGSLDQAGLPVGTWDQSGFDKGTYECSYEKSSGKATGEDKKYQSFFIIVRGDTDGNVSSVRMKLIFPETGDGSEIKTKFLDAVRTLFKQSQWLDFSEDMEAFTSLENVTRSDYGVKLTFSREFDSDKRFNFIMVSDRLRPDQRRTADYFNPDKWRLMHPLPPEAPAPAADETMPKDPKDSKSGKI